MTQFIQINGVPAPITRQGVIHNVAAAVGSARTTNPISQKVKACIIAPDQDCYMRVGGADVIVTGATDGSIVFAGSYYFALVDPGQHIAFIRKDVDGLVNITECAP